MNLTRRTKTIISGILLLIVVVLLYLFRTALPIFILALLVAYILSPLVDVIESKQFFKRKIPRGISILLIYIAMLSGIGIGGGYFITNLTIELKTLVKDIPTYRQHFNEKWVPAISEQIEHFNRFIPKIENEEIEDLEIKTEIDVSKNIKEEPYSELLELFKTTKFEVRQSKNGFEIIPHEITIESKTQDEQKFDPLVIIDNFIADFSEDLQGILLNLLDFGKSVLFSLFASFFQTMLVLMVAAFIIIDKKRILSFFIELFPSRFLNKLEIFMQLQNKGLNGVVRGQIIISLVNGSLTGVGLLLLDIKFALTLSILATVCSIIPIFGVIISSIPIVLMAVTTSFFTAILALLWILGIHFVEGNFLNPKILGKAAKIHPVFVIFALVAGERTFGLFGALIAVPVFSILQNSFLFIRESILTQDEVRSN